MTVNHNDRRSSRLSVVSHATIALALACALAACGKDQPAQDAAATSAATTAPAVTPETAVSAKVSALTVDQLREAARKAYAENRLYAPVEDNAVEYYLALRDKAPADAAVSSALTDLLPMTVIATEQSVGREDFAEAQRLAALLEKADAQHPALARLKASITAKQQEVAKRAEQQVLTAEEQAKKQAELEKQRLAQQEAQQRQAATQLAASQAAERQAAASREADQRAADQRAADQRAAEQRAADARAAEARQTAAAASTPSAGADLRAVSTPAPRYPPEALRAGQSGEVQVEFTVGTDGSVTAARVVRSNPARIFDREAVNAVRKWRFQPVGAPVTTRRTIGFNPGG
ncbi:TonB family protein [Lysobacter sp. 5GHs7-4]|uniref:energy transducer TonB n=1 Tax=Lysobacter sp. 5GHs7-4 TaxID=2904253 RepID=UPI0017B23B99|nr:energy transducer TonB [Lysobacter sp. 5GHs7-4]NUO77501.1 TonB family protein [Lysobacter sp.]UHQ23398.1 TonB family protein [Lysobacter sp. 5GHs7-4]